MTVLGTRFGRKVKPGTLQFAPEEPCRAESGLEMTATICSNPATWSLIDNNRVGKQAAAGSASNKWA